MKTNTKYKNGVFTMLFNDPDLLKKLYCALKGVKLPPEAIVSINTLENVLFMDFNNDLSFEIDGKLIILIEHQSTINPNMALRLLIYFSRVIEKTVKSNTLYSKKRMPIPWPEFFVLYNGKDPYPDTDILRLSDLYIQPENLRLPEKLQPLLELEVKVININEGKNKKIVNRCKELSGYSAFMARIYEFWNETGNLEEGIRKAIKYCQKNGILTEFLEIHGSEVLNMLLTEWNTEDAIAYAREEGREEGLEAGREAGRDEVFTLLAQGLSIEEIKLRLK